MFDLLRNSFFCLALLTSITAYSQQYDYSFEQYNTDNGLSHEHISCMVKDRDGFLWIATVNGLNRFDGLIFKSFVNNPLDSASLPGNNIAGITLDKKGYMWIATNKGLCRMDTRKRTIQRISINKPGETSRNDVMYGEFDSKGIGWFLADNFLYAINQDNFTWKRYQLPTMYYHANVAQVDSKDRIWLTIGRAKYLFDPRTAKFTYLMGRDNEHTNTDLLCGWVKEDNTGKIWMATWAKSFYTWNEQKRVFERMDSVDMSLTRFEFDIDEKGRPVIWCGGGAYGLMSYDMNTKKYFQFKNDPRNKYSHNLGQTVYLLKDTASGIVWIGTEKGLEKYDPYGLRFKRHYIWQSSDKLTNSQYFLPSAFIQDKTDPSGDTYWISVWIGGIFKFNRQLGTHQDFMAPEGLKNEGVFHMIQARDGKLWIGHGSGLQSLDPNTGKFSRTIDDFFPNQNGNKGVNHLIEDKEGNIWMTSYQGLFEWEKKKNKVFNWQLVDPSISKSVGGLVEDGDGNIWVSNNTDGMIRIDPVNKTTRHYTNATRKGKKLPDDLLGGMLIDKDQNLWVAGIGFIARLNKDAELLDLYTNANGYFGTSVFSMKQDPQGYIWFATDNMLYRLNSTERHFDYFNKEDGLLSNQVADGFDITPDGELFLGFNGSYCSIETNKINFNRTPPSIIVTEFLVNGQPRDFDENRNIKLRYREKNILIRFAALNYSQTQKNKYAFILEGIDTGWKYTYDRTVMLMNPEGGTHRIHIKASNNDGVWSDEIIYTIKVIPPFTKTIGFTILLVLMAGGIVYLIAWYRKYQRRKLEKIRDRIATDLHDDMGSTLSSIRIFSDVAKKSVSDRAPDTLPLLERISSNAASLSENIQDIVWTIRNDNDSLEDLVTRMREFGLRVCDAKQVKFQVEVSKNFRTSKLTLEQRRNLYMIFKETINNAVKYAECSQIDLMLVLMGRYLKMDITDNGKGFEMNKIKRGNGLNNLEKRAKEINGEINIATGKEKGTKISLLIILRKSALGEPRR